MRKHITMLIGAIMAMFFVVAATGGAFAQAKARASVPVGKIAYVDLLKFMSKSKKVLVRQKKMQDLQKKKRDELIKLQGDIKKLQEELKKQGPMLKQETLKLKERKIQHMAIDLRTMEQQAKADLEAESRENQRIIMRNLSKVVSDIRAHKKYAFIFKAAALLSADDAMDITEEVIKRYDSMAEAAAPKRPVKRSTGAKKPPPKR